MASLFFSYSHADEALRDQLEKQFSLLKRQGVIQAWHDRRIGAGGDFAKDIDRHVETDDIILLLVSADFLDSDYCYEKEMIRTMERHEAGKAVVIPVILRPCDWHGAPFGKLNASPPDGRPVTQYPDRDQAMLEVAKAVRAAAERFNAKSNPVANASPPQSPAAPATEARSSNLRMAKSFSERDTDEFRTTSFEFMAKFFENSLKELSARNAAVETSFRRIDANCFMAKVYNGGQTISRCTIFIGDRMLGGGIAYSAAETTERNGYNEMLTVKSDDQSIFMRAMGMPMHRGGGDIAKLSQEGAAEYYWSMLIEPLQRPNR